MTDQQVIYICPVCFLISESAETDHHHEMLRCDIGAHAGERRKPIQDASGNLSTRAPRWFVEARNQSRGQVFFICPTCFRVCEREEECHDHLMIRCDVNELSDDSRKPVLDESTGKLRSPVPRWFKDALQNKSKS